MQGQKNEKKEPVLLFYVVYSLPWTFALLNRREGPFLGVESRQARHGSEGNVENIPSL